VNLELRVSAAFLSSKVALVTNEERDLFGPKMDWNLWRTSTAVSVGNLAEVIPFASSLFIQLVFGTLSSYVDKNRIRILMTKMLQAKQMKKFLGYCCLGQNILRTLLLYELLNIISYRMIQII